MKVDFKIIISVIIALLIGLGIGYLTFRNKTDNGSATREHFHSNEVSAGEETWTCSMHPQIRQNEQGDCPICGMDLIILEENTSNDPLVLEMTTEAVKLANIQTTIVGEINNGEASESMRLSGKVQADERLASSQVAHVPGRIEKLFVSFTGEQVNKGQKIATLYSPELITAQKELIEALKLQTLNPNLVEAARNKLRYWKIDKPSIENIEQTGIIQETFTVYADEAGTVTNRRVSVGDYIKQGEPLFELINLRKVWVLFDAYEEDLATIKIGDKIEFNTPAISNKTFKTKVTFIDPIINPKTRSTSIRTEIQNLNSLLKPEMLVYGTLENKTNSTVQLSVPKSAVLWTGKRSVVYVKVPDMTVPSFQFREVKIGSTQGNTYEILEGLDIGEEVVTYGSFTIDAAAQLNNQASMMNRNIKLKNEANIILLPDYTSTTPVEFKNQLANVSTAYLSLKDALVETDSELAIDKSKNLEVVLSKVDMSLVKADAHSYWMQQLKAIQSHNKEINSADNIEAQRKQFDFLSQALIKAVKAFGITNDILYVQHCPMANNNEGADWLSAEEKIQNPYFGDKMMTCGLVKTTIDSHYKNLSTPKKSQSNFHNH